MEASKVEVPSTAGLQDVLFEGDFAPLPEDIGFRGPIACTAAGITYRQLDYWARTGLVVPSIKGADGSGSHRLYGFRDILLLKVVKRLLDVGISLQQIRAAILHLRERGVRDLTAVTLMSDGVSVYQAVSDEEIIDLVHGGQGVFAIALGRVWHDLEGNLAERCPPNAPPRPRSLPHPPASMNSPRGAPLATSADLLRRWAR